MKILVTGATGFIGNYVISELLKYEKYEIFATSIDSIKDVRNLTWFDKVNYISRNLDEDDKNYFIFFNEPDVLIHLSWAGLPNYKELFHFEKNLFANYKFIKNMVVNGLKNLSVIGTCAEYGMIEGSLTEKMDVNPVTPYGLAKDTLRRFIEELNKKYNFIFKWIRLFYLFGKEQNPKSLLSQLDRALDNNDKIFNMSGGEQIRDYLRVEKVAEYIVKISLQDKITGIINCCSGKPISIKKIVENHMKRRNKYIDLNLGYYKYIDYEPMAFWGDNHKLKQILNYYEGKKD